MSPTSSQWVKKKKRDQRKSDTLHRFLCKSKGSHWSLEKWCPAQAQQMCTPCSQLWGQTMQQAVSGKGKEGQHIPCPGFSPQCPIKTTNAWTEICPWTRFSKLQSKWVVRDSFTFSAHLQREWENGRRIYNLYPALACLR